MRRADFYNRNKHVHLTELYRMKNPLFVNRLLICLLLLSSAACRESSMDSTPQPTNGPIGTTTALRAGTLKAENGTPTAGMVSVVRDANSDEYVSLADDFKSEFGTGTVAVYLAKSAANIKSQRTKADGSPNGAGNVLAIGFLTKNGRQFLKLPTASTGYSHLVLYCETIEINFGNAPLQ